MSPGLISPCWATDPEGFHPLYEIGAIGRGFYVKSFRSWGGRLETLALVRSIAPRRPCTLRAQRLSFRRAHTL